ncbi:hypothetical protein ACH9EU_03110 [Kocuria sp. M1R5S2]|uniref:hypothetical protein n=1 Tax=Kocuria rhizosphaerae TaxID=3376285 RepID=UPI0037BBD037
MKFNVQRVLTPAYLTSVALIVLGVFFGMVWNPVAAWVFALAGLVLNAVAVSVTAIDDAPRTTGAEGRRRPSLPGRRPRTAGANAGSHDAGSHDAGGPRHGDAPPARPGPAAEPEAETQATPVVPPRGSAAVKPPH